MKLATPGQEQAAGMDNNTPTPAAYYLTAAGAYVTVSNAEIAGGVKSTVTCEACGRVGGAQIYGGTQSDGTPFAQIKAEQDAQGHAANCRKLPQRLWPTGGAS